LFDIANIRQQSEYARIIFTENRNSLGNPNKIKGLQVKKSLQQGNSRAILTQQQGNSRHNSKANQARKWEQVGRSGEGKGEILGRGLSLLLPPTSGLPSNTPPNNTAGLPRCLL